MLCNDVNCYNIPREWIQWCDEHLNEIKKDFMIDLVVMNPSNPRCFGDWVRYNGHSVLDIICNQNLFNIL